MFDSHLHAIRFGSPFKFGREIRWWWRGRSIDGPASQYIAHSASGGGDDMVVRYGAAGLGALIIHSPVQCGHAPSTHLEDGLVDAGSQQMVASHRRYYTIHTTIRPCIELDAMWNQSLKFRN